MAQTTAEVAGTTTTTGLRRHLGLPDVIAQSVTVIAPGMSGAFLTYLAATKAGGATPLAFLLAALGALCIGGVVSEFGKSLPSAGSLYTYTTVGLSRTAGFALGWMYSIAFIILSGAVLAGFGFFTSLLISSLTDGGTVVAWYWFFLASLVFVGVMSLFDVKVSTRTQLAFTALSVALMVVAAIAVIGKGTPALSVIDGTTPVAQAGKSIDLGAFWPSAAGIPWSGILFGFAFGILSFTGFEAGAVLAEETANPKRNIPRAVVGSVLVGGLFYLLVTYATSIGFGVRQAAIDWPTSAAGLVAVAPSKGMGDLVLFAVAVSSLFCGLGVHTAASSVPVRHGSRAGAAADARPDPPALAHPVERNPAELGADGHPLLRAAGGDVEGDPDRAGRWRDRGGPQLPGGPTRRALCLWLLGHVGHARSHAGVPPARHRRHPQGPGR